MSRKFEVTFEITVEDDAPIWPADNLWDLTAVGMMVQDAMYETESEFTVDPQVKELY